MKRSETTGALAKALAAAQKVMDGPSKDKTAKIGNSHSYKYADLASTIDCYRDALADRGIALIQPICHVDGHMVLETTLLHESGEWCSSEYPVALFAKAQEQGSAITYARRYAVQAMLGIASEDDDGKAATENAENARHATPKAAPNGNGSAKVPPPGGPLTNDQRGELLDLAKTGGISNAALLALCSATLKRHIGSSADIGQGDFKAVLAAVETAAMASKEEDVNEVFGAAR